MGPLAPLAPPPAGKLALYTASAFSAAEDSCAAIPVIVASALRSSKGRRRRSAAIIRAGPWGEMATTA